MRSLSQPGSSLQSAGCQRDSGCKPGAGSPRSEGVGDGGNGGGAAVAERCSTGAGPCKDTAEQAASSAPTKVVAAATLAR